MRYSELTKKLARLGVEFYREAKKHEIWWRPGTGQRTSIPRHRGDEVPSGTLKRILNDLGLTEEDLAGK